MKDNIRINEKGQFVPIEYDFCLKTILIMSDTLDVLNGKWRIPLIIYLSFGSRRFTDISKELKGITDRTLSKELKSLEENLLITRLAIDSFPPTVEYSITDHGISVTKVLIELRKWGEGHRKLIISNNKK